LGFLQFPLSVAGKGKMMHFKIFMLGSGPGYNLSNGKSNLMKKAKMDFLKR
jgi:hypothetical protein